MKLKYGVILLDAKKLIVRIYERDSLEWKLSSYKFIHLQKSTPVKAVEAIVKIFSSNYAEHIIDWKVVALHTRKKVVNQVSTATGLIIERLTQSRQEDIICKGMLLELL